MLKRRPRSGWQALNIPNPESVADHTCRSVFIAFILAKMEKADAQRTALISAFHEMPETRLSDLDKVAQRYLEKKKIEKAIVQDQLQLLPNDIASDLSDFYTGFEEDETREHVIAKDADYVEVILQAREYLDQGYVGAQNWIDNAQGLLKTESAKKLVAEIITTGSTDWFKLVKHIER